MKDSRKRPIIIPSDEEGQREDPQTDTGRATTRRRLSRLRRAAEVPEDEEGDDVVDLTGDATATAATGAQRPTQPLPALVTPTRPPPARRAAHTSPQATQPAARRSRRRPLTSAKKQRQSKQLERLISKRCGSPASPRRGRNGSGSGSAGGSEGTEGEGSEEEEEDVHWDEDLGDFVVEDNEDAGPALEQLRGITAGADNSDESRHMLYCHLRLARLLGGLPAPEALAPAELALINAALQVERDLQQQRENANNLEGWRRADQDLRGRFEEYAVVEAEDGGWHWGRNCCFCRHDRRKHVHMHKLNFRGRRSPVVWLEPKLRRLGLLPGGSEPEHGMPHAGPSSSEESSSSSSSEDELLIDGFKRRQRQRQRQPQRGRGRQAGQQQPPSKRRRVEVVASEDSEEGEEEEEEQASSREEKDIVASSGSDPDSDDTDASGNGELPRHHPRIGVDCWARAYVYHAIHRYPSRLDTVLLWLTRRYLRRTPEARQPASLLGLSAAVVERCGEVLVRHFRDFKDVLDRFKQIQNMRCDKTPANYQVVRRLQSLLYPRAAEPSEDEQARGVRISAELEAFTARLARRRRRHPGTAPEQGLLLRFEGWAQEEARVEGVGAGLLEDDSDGWVVEEESDGEDSGQPAYRWHAREAAGTQQRQQRWQQRQQQPEGRRRQQQPEPQGGQRGAAAIAAAAADFQHRRQQEQEQQEKEKDRQAQLQQQEQEQQKQQQRATERFPDPDFLRLALQSPRAAHRRITWRTVMVFDRLVGTCPVSYGSRAGGTKLCLQGRTCSDVRQRPLIGNGTYRVDFFFGPRDRRIQGWQADFAAQGQTLVVDVPADALETWHFPDNPGDQTLRLQSVAGPDIPQTCVSLATGPGQPGAANLGPFAP